MTDHDIREWAKGKGIDIKDSGPIPARIRNQYTDNVIGGGDSDGEEKASDVEAPPRLEEIPPKTTPPKKAQALSKARDVFARRTPAKKTVRPRKPRVSIDKVVSRAWDFFSAAVKPINLPVSRVLAMQSPVAGMVLEDTIKNTLIDRALQPVARAGRNAEIAEALIGPPLIVAALTTKPSMAPLLVPALKDALRTWIDIAGPSIEKAQVREEEFEKKYGTKIDEMITYILSPDTMDTDVSV